MCAIVRLGGIFLCGAVVGVGAQNAAAAPKWTEIEVPESSETIPAGINDHGMVTGYAGGEGFVWAPGGSLITFQAPQADDGTQPVAIGKSGAIVGSYVKMGRTHDFVRAPDGTFTTFDAPDALLTVPGAINGHGAIAGYWRDVHIVDHGFLRTPRGKIESFDVPGATLTQAYVMNDDGVITGQYVDVNSNRHGFVRDAAGGFTTYDIPSVTPQDLEPKSINAGGEIVGDYVDANGHTFGFLREPNGTVTTLDYSNGSSSPYTLATGINDLGDIAGYCTDSAGEHGFLRTPDGRVTALVYPGADETIAVGINNKSQIAGAFLQGSLIAGYFVKHVR